MKIFGKTHKRTLSIYPSREVSGEEDFVLFVAVLPLPSTPLEQIVNEAGGTFRKSILMKNQDVAES